MVPVVGIISNLAVYFYQPDKTAVAQGQNIFIPQGDGYLWNYNGDWRITALGMIFDAVTDPLIASWSDRCQSKNGRRNPIFEMASLPLAVSTVLVFWSPVEKTSWINGDISVFYGDD